MAVATLIDNGYDDTHVHGFDLACVPKSKLFTRTKGRRLLVRFVSRVDGEAVAEAWVQAGKWRTPSQEETCIFLVEPSITPPHELVDAIARQRRKSSHGGNVTLIPIDVRDWDVRVPTDAPAEDKKVLAGLRTLT